MRRHQRGVTTLGWIILLIPVAIVFYAGVRILPIYLNYMNVTHALTQVASEIGGDVQSSDPIRTSIGKHFDVEQITFPDVKDIKISRVDGVWSMEAEYEDQAPLFANVFILVTFDKSVRLKGGGANQ
jgi:hypothetical protein